MQKNPISFKEKELREAAESPHITAFPCFSPFPSLWSCGNTRPDHKQRSARGRSSKALACPTPPKRWQGEEPCGASAASPKLFKFLLPLRSPCSLLPTAALNQPATQPEDQAACDCRRLHGGLIYMQHVLVLQAALVQELGTGEIT